MKKLLTTLLAAILIFSYAWYRQRKTLDSLDTTLIVGTSADFAPFSFRDKDNAIVGLDIDIVQELAKRLNKQLELKDRPFNALLPDIELGNIQIIAAGITPTDKRAESVHFTQPHVTGNPLVVVTLPKNPPIKDLTELKDKKIAVNTGYISDAYMSELGGFNLLRLPKVADAFTALENGKVDAFVVSKYTLQPYLNSLPEEKALLTTFELKETDEKYALALSKKLPAAYVQKIKDTLTSMQSDGTIDKLKQKWSIA
jgi:arginine/lysine/histidine transporter system substrate-binding protein